MNLPLLRQVTLGARLNLAALLMRGGALPQAEQVAQEITELAPEVALAWYNLGLIRRQAGNLVGGAVKAYERSRGLDPKHAETHQNLAVAALLARGIHSSCSSFAEAIRLLEAQGRGGEAEVLREHLAGLVKVSP